MVCAILPATNPTATCGGKAVGILKGRNAVIFKPSSRALKSTTEAINMMRAGLRKVGAPEDLIQVLEDPSREAITELMKVSDLIVATGSGQVVRAAYSSGTPAYGVGQGNACAIVAEDADVAEAAKMICGSKLFDYATSCSSENAVIPVEAVYDQFMAEMKKNGCYLVTGEDREKLKNHMWKPNAKGKIALNPDIIAKSAQVIADGAGISIPEGTDILLVEGMEPILGDKFHDEKISPVLTVYKAKDFKDAYRILVELTNLVVRGLYKTFRAYDAQLAEINPLFITKDGKAIAGDGKLIIDDNSVWRQPSYPLTRDYFDSEVEFEAAQEGIPYLQFNGDIALMCAGAGLTTTVFDLINDAGGHPATYVEFGGANYTKAVRTMELCLKTPSKVILVVTFGTIARADVMAQGLVEAIKAHQPKQPIVTCIRGTNEEEAFAILRDAGLEPLTNTEEAVQRAVDIAAGRA